MSRAIRSRSATLARCSTSPWARRSFSFWRLASAKWMLGPPTTSEMNAAGIQGYGGSCINHAWARTTATTRNR